VLSLAAWEVAVRHDEVAISAWAGPMYCMYVGCTWYATLYAVLKGRCRDGERGIER
jgi:hypothetical protein